MQELIDADSLTLRKPQNVSKILELWKVLFCLVSPSGKEVYYGAENQGETFLGAQVLKDLLPGKFYIVDPEGAELLLFKRSLNFLSHRLDVFDPEKNFLGYAEKTASLKGVSYQVRGVDQKISFKIEGNISDLSVFHILNGEGLKVGKISRKWSPPVEIQPGSPPVDAPIEPDRFGIIFPFGIDIVQKSLLLAVLFLIDFASLEDERKAEKNKTKNAPHKGTSSKA